MSIIRVGAEQFRRRLTELLNRVSYGGDEVIVERNGRPPAVLRPYLEGEQTIVAVLSDEIERTPALANELEAARLAAGITYEELAQQLHLERLRTLLEKYPDFAAKYIAEVAPQSVDARTENQPPG